MPRPKKPEFKTVPIAPELEHKINETLALVRALSEHVTKRDPACAPLRAVRRERGLSSVPCTQANFHLLPGLVSRSTFREWTGLSEGDITEGVRAGRIQTYRPKADGYRLYYKAEIARMTGFKL